MKAPLLLVAEEASDEVDLDGFLRRYVEVLLAESGLMEGGRDGDTEGYGAA